MQMLIKHRMATVVDISALEILTSIDVRFWRL